VLASQINGCNLSASPIHPSDVDCPGLHLYLNKTRAASQTFS